MTTDTVRPTHEANVMGEAGHQPKLLLHGIDTLQCAYFLLALPKQGIDFAALAVAKAGLRQDWSCPISVDRVGLWNRRASPGLLEPDRRHLTRA